MQIPTLANGGCFLSALSFFTADFSTRGAGFPSPSQLHAAGAQLRLELCQSLLHWAASLPGEQYAQLLQSWEIAGEQWSTIEDYAAAMSDEFTWWARAPCHPNGYYQLRPNCLV